MPDNTVERLGQLPAGVSFDVPIREVKTNFIMDRETFDMLRDATEPYVNGETWTNLDDRLWLAIRDVAIGYPKTTTSGKYRGKLGVRALAFFHANWPNTEKELMKHAGRVEMILSYVANHYPGQKLYYAEVVPHLNWKDGDFGDADSCFFNPEGGRRSNWYALCEQAEKGNVGAVRVYRKMEEGRGGEGFARALLARYWPYNFNLESASNDPRGEIVLFNAYGLPSSSLAAIAESLIGLKFYPHSTDQVSASIYVNGQGYHGDAAKFSVYSTHKDKSVKVGLGYINPRSHEHRVARCADCDGVFDREALSEVNGSYVCLRCLAHYWQCARCAVYFRDEHGDPLISLAWWANAWPDAPYNFSNTRFCPNCARALRDDAPLAAQNAFDQVFVSCAHCGTLNPRTDLLRDDDGLLFCARCYERRVCQTCHRYACTCRDAFLAAALTAIRAHVEPLGFQVVNDLPSLELHYGWTDKAPVHQESPGIRIADHLAVAFKIYSRGAFLVQLVVDGIAMTAWSIYDVSAFVAPDGRLDGLIMPFNLPALLTDAQWSEVVHQAIRDRADNGRLVNLVRHDPLYNAIHNALNTTEQQRQQRHG